MECKCENPILQDATKQCGRCDKYIDRRRHLELTYSKKKFKKYDVYVRVNE